MKKTTINANPFHPLAAAVAAGLLAVVPLHAYAQTKPAPAAAPAAAKPAPAPVITPEPLAKFLGPLLKSDRRIAAAAEDMAAAKQKSSAASGDWFPTLKVTSWVGGQGADQQSCGDRRHRPQSKRNRCHHHPTDR